MMNIILLYMHTLQKRLFGHCCFADVSPSFLHKSHRMVKRQLGTLYDRSVLDRKKWVCEKPRVGSRIGRLFQKCLIELVQNLTR
jgi:hypothetical protein